MSTRGQHGQDTIQRMIQETEEQKKQADAHHHQRDGPDFQHKPVRGLFHNAHGTLRRRTKPWVEGYA